MKNKFIIWGFMIAFIGLGLGFTIGRSADPFKIGQVDTPKNETSMKNPPDEQKNDQENRNTAGDYDLNFINAMIAHHETAIAMATEAKEKSQKDEIKKMSDDIIKAQSREIEHLKLWKEDWYGDR